MREIKFRGKSADGKWIYGSLLQTKTLSFICKAMSKVKTRNYLIEKQETIGEYTGLKDKNGVEIYEGDILEDILEDRATVEWSDEDAMFILISDNVQTDFSKEASTWWELIGNIYDNPELIEKEGK